MLLFAARLLQRFDLKLNWSTQEQLSLMLFDNFKSLCICGRSILAKSPGFSFNSKSCNQNSQNEIFQHWRLKKSKRLQKIVLPTSRQSAGSGKSWAGRGHFPSCSAALVIAFFQHTFVISPALCQKQHDESYATPLSIIVILSYHIKFDHFPNTDCWAGWVYFPSYNVADKGRRLICYCMYFEKRNFPFPISLTINYKWSLRSRRWSSARNVSLSNVYYW